MVHLSPVSHGTPAKHNLPAEIASFVGREGAIAEIRRLVARARLLTLTGAGGCGKTRLAVRAAADAAQSFPDGVWFVPLAPLTDSAFVPRAVAAAVGIRGAASRSMVATLVAALASRQILLVLDNCEHLIGGCARLAETLLRACPSLRILATSREPLRIPGEVTWRVPSLAVPGVQPLPSPESLAQVESVALFLDRARARQPAFALSAQTAPAVAAICRQLAGLPLAIELAAAQLWTLTPDQIVGRLDNGLRLLGGGSRTQPRQETLRATLDWSHALLCDAEQALFRRLAVFAGGFEVEAAESVCSDREIAPADVLPLLTALVEKSLVEPTMQLGEARYHLLEPVRQYALERLTMSGEAGGAERGHARYFGRLAEMAEPRLMSGKRGPWLERLAQNQDNLRAALGWSRRAAEASARELGLRLAGALGWFWNLRGEVSEGLDWLEAALAGGQDAAPAVRAKALYASAELAWLVGQNELARARAEESASLFRSLDDKRGLAYTLQSLPMANGHPQAAASTAESLRLFKEIGDAWGVAMAMAALDLSALISDGDPSGRGQAQLQEALAWFRALGDDWGIAQVLNMLGDLARSQDDFAGAGVRYDEALTLLRRQGLTGSVPSLLHNLGAVALRGGEPQRARRLFRESLGLFRDQGDQRGVADCLTGLAGVLAALKQPERAAQLLGAAEALREAIGATMWPANEASYDRTLSEVLGRLGKAGLAAAWAAGRALPLERMITEALAEQAGDPPGNRQELGLTVREREVVALVAQGLTNRQIGGALFITEGTARLHVKHILSKLGFTSRTQIAGWAVDQGLARAPGAL